MLTCGTYDAAGDFAYDVGIPGKSGVGGGIVGVIPNRLAVAVWSPGAQHQGQFTGRQRSTGTLHQQDRPVDLLAVAKKRRNASTVRSIPSSSMSRCVTSRNVGR